MADCFRLGVALDQINTEIKKRFEKEAIEIPYPARTVYVKEEGDRQ
ncbi:MAG: hypothetical protein HY026_02220 [Deltaproteobacteria bacterium]|nr:hypothetical protein [Deltaproteobacteria bacterium]